MLEQRSQGHPGPLCIANCSEFPLRSLHLWDQKDPTIARALQGRDPRFGWHASQLVIAQNKRLPDRTIDSQLIGGAIQVWRRKMTAYVEQFRRSEVGVDRIERSLQILRLLLPDDQARRKPGPTSAHTRLLPTSHD